MLFETIVALLLLGLCLLPLAALVDGLSASVRRMEEGLSSDDRSQEDMQRRWDWGPRVVGAEWRPNGALEVQAVGGAGQVSAAVGLWMDGWFRLEVAVDSGGRAVFTAGDFAHVAEGAEVIIRVREERGAWGPPWRNSVGTETEGAGVGSTITEEVSTLVVHSPMAGSWEMSLQAGGVVRVTEVTGPLGVEMPGGSVCANLSGREQRTGEAWWVGEGRYVHLYF